MRPLVLLLIITAAVPADAARRRSATSGISSVDCRAQGPCPKMTIDADLSELGFADPSMRLSPSGKVIWMAYSRPHRQTISGGSVVAVDSQLACSIDQGRSWQFFRKLWPARQIADDTGEQGFANSETVTLAHDGTSWYSARLHYFTSPSRGPKVTSFTLRVATAPSPQTLPEALEAILGGDLTNEFWQADVNLAALSPELAGCTWNDPALLFRNGTLYLATQCMRFENGEEVPEDELIAVFATLPAGSPRSWTWRYAGALSGHAEAQELGGEMLQQTDLAVAKDGSLLAIVSPAVPTEPLATHFGCRAVEVEALDPPRLARDDLGRLRLRAIVNVSDQPPYGPGACGYDAASTTGVVIVRRTVTPRLDVSMHATGIHP